MGGIFLPSSNGSTFVLGVKVNPEMNELIEKMALTETKGNKSEMIRILLSEAIRERENNETMINEMSKEME